MLRDAPGPLFLRRQVILRRQRRVFLKKDGVTRTTAPQIEDLYLRTLAILEPIFAVRPYLFGARPCEADFGLFGPFFRHFSSDPTPAAILRERAPHTFAWVSRLWAATPAQLAASPVATEAPSDLDPLLAMACNEYLPYLAANSDAVCAGKKEVSWPNLGIAWLTPDLALSSPVSGQPASGISGPRCRGAQLDRRTPDARRDQLTGEASCGNRHVHDAKGQTARPQLALSTAIGHISGAPTRQNSGEDTMTDLVTVTDRGHVRTVVLNRPQVKNALSDELAWSVINAVDDAARDDNVWVVAITGTGDAFCAGLDLTMKERTSPLSPQNAQLDDLGWVGHFLLSIRKRCDKPVVGGVNGVAVGAGLGLAMACDVRLVAKSARLMAGYTRIGGSPDGGLTITLPQAMGYERAMRFMMENRTVTGEEAVAIGMAGEVVDDTKFGDRLGEYCDELCRWSPITLRLLKRGMVKSMESSDMEQQLRFELANIRRAFASEDAQEARQAFTEKRPPVFKGK